MKINEILMQDARICKIDCIDLSAKYSFRFRNPGIPQNILIESSTYTRPNKNGTALGNWH